MTTKHTQDVGSDYSMSKFASRDDMHAAMLNEISALREAKAELLEALIYIEHGLSQLKEANAGFAELRRARAAIAKAANH